MKLRVMDCLVLLKLAHHLLKLIKGDLVVMGSYGYLAIVIFVAFGEYLGEEV